METLSSGSWTTSTDGLGAGAGRPTASMPGGSSMQTSAAPSPAEELQAKISKFWSGYSPAGLIPGLLEFLQLRGSSVDKVKVTDSSGSVLTFIIDGVDAVIQHYKDPELFGQLVEKFEHLKKHADTPGVASRVAAIRGIDPKLRNLFVTKVTPLNSLFPPAGRTPEAQAAARQKLSAFVQKNALKILVDCSASIDALAKIGLAQRDVTVDNIGIQGDTFVLFDFNLLAEGTKETVKVDHQSLVRSLRHHGWKDAPAIEHHGELQEICDEEAMAGLKIDLTVR